MEYDSVKHSLNSVLRNTFLRKCFYVLLDGLLLRAWHIKKELRGLKKSLPANASVLDAGAGFGQYVYYMSRLGRKWRIKAVDVKAGQVADCNRFFEPENGRVRFETADLTVFCEPDAYHLVLSVDVMEHIADDEAVFANICRSLKKGGTLLISTPSDKGGSDADEHHGSFIDEHVRNGYNIADIQDKLKRAGFSHTDASYTYGTAGHIAWLLCMKFPLLLLHVSKLFFLLLPLYYLIVFPLCVPLNLADVYCRKPAGTGLKVKAVK
ncbi:MAG: class I SAM-dependent methyltransferase [Bacteroidales bacterium]|jgi:SAM-dependent methyltransferase|nr:class I SAM-dependent methyltransferase [Bacteroidales bacterium]